MSSPLSTDAPGLHPEPLDVLGVPVLLRSTYRRLFPDDGVKQGQGISIPSFPSQNECLFHLGSATP